VTARPESRGCGVLDAPVKPGHDAGVLGAKITVPITKTAMFEVPYHHIKGVFTPEVSNGVPHASAPGHIVCRGFWLK